MAVSHAIRRTAVIGAGTMGRQIAAMIAGSNTPVLLLDIVPKGANDRDKLAKEALRQLRESNTITSEEKAALIQPGNVEDDLDKLADMDWVIECVPEREDTKRETYAKAGQYLGRQALLSSNTSTIPLRTLRRGLPAHLQRRLCITHFFNPPAKMPLMELVTDQDNAPEALAALTRFADEKLGRNVIPASDSPGFIANRIGFFWLLCAMEESRKENVEMAMADAVMNGAFGFPKTGVFGLADLIGLTLIPEIARSMRRLLPPDDAFCQLTAGLKLIEERLQEGRKKFYDKKSETPELDIRHWHGFLAENTAESRFARRTLTRTLEYAAAVAPSVADHILDVDAAMRDGYGWEYGPFEMMDRLGVSWLIEHMRKQDMHVPVLLKQAEVQGFYRTKPGGGREHLGFSGRYLPQRPGKKKWTLALVTAGKKPLLQNTSAELHDIGDGIACFAPIKGKMHVIDEEALALLVQAVELAESDFNGLIIGHDGRHFSAGVDLSQIIMYARARQWSRIEALLKQGQDCMLRIRQAKMPVVGAISGYTLGGGCELVLHCAAIQAHTSTRIGLVETDIGVIPAWGGTKEHLLRAIEQGSGDTEAISKHLRESFRRIARARKSLDADDAFTQGFLREPSQTTANRERLLPDAKALCLNIGRNYTPGTERTIEAPVETLSRCLKEEVMALTEREQPGMTQHRHRVLEQLAEVLSGRAAVKAQQQMLRQEPPRAGWDTFSETMVLQAERKAFMTLVQEKEALEKIEAILD